MSPLDRLLLKIKRKGIIKSMLAVCRYPFCFDKANVLVKVADSPKGHTPREMFLTGKKFVPIGLKAIDN